MPRRRGPTSSWHLLDHERAGAGGVRGEEGWTVDVPDLQGYRVMAQLDLRHAIS